MLRSSLPAPGHLVLSLGALAGVIGMGAVHASAADEPEGDVIPAIRMVMPGAPISTDALREKGRFGLPVEEAQVLCDNDELLVRLWNDADDLVVQAIVWNDGDDALGETPDGRPLGDSSSLVLDVAGDGVVTPNVDHNYALNAWPTLPGLTYSVPLGGGMSTPLQSDSEGRGCIEYVNVLGDRKVRVDTFVVPLGAHDLAPGDSISVAYLASSPAEGMRANSIGFDAGDRVYYTHHLPRADFHAVTLAQEPFAWWNSESVTRGRDAAKPEVERAASLPEVGQAPPAFTAESWINTEEDLSLAALRGKVAVVEFWATWCGPCVANIPHLNQLHAKHKDDGLVIVALTDQSERGIRKFLQRTEMNYAIGTGSQTSRAYGVSGIPHAFVVGRDGTLLWEGHPAGGEMDAVIARALAE